MFNAQPTGMVISRRGVIEKDIMRDSLLPCCNCIVLFVFVLFSTIDYVLWKSAIEINHYYHY